MDLYDWCSESPPMRKKQVITGTRSRSLGPQRKGQHPTLQKQHVYQPHLVLITLSVDCLYIGTHRRCTGEHKILDKFWKTCVLVLLNTSVTLDKLHTFCRSFLHRKK